MMQRSGFFLATLGLALIGGVTAGDALAAGPDGSMVLAQASSGASKGHTSSKDQSSLPIVGGGVATGAGAPTSASSSVAPTGRGAPPPGMSDSPGLGASTGGSNLTPNGAIRPGAAGTGSGTGGNGR